MATTSTIYNVVQIDTGPPGPHTGHKTLRVANVEGGSGDYVIVWRPICDLSPAERKKISCPLDYRDNHLPDSNCTISPPCSYYNDYATCCRSGNCGGDGIYSRYRTGETDRELIVTMDNIPQFAQNFGAPCQLIFYWTLTDQVTGDTMDGCCGVIFEWRVITPPPLNVTISECTSTLLVDTSLESPGASKVLSITNVTGGIGPYTAEWAEENTASTCIGTFTDTIVPSGEVGNSTQFDAYEINLTNVPRFTINDTPLCKRSIRWIVRDLGLLNELGQPVGRVESGVCTTTFNYKIVTPPAITAQIIGCNQIVDIQTGSTSAHSGTQSMQVGDISGGSGNYTVTWNTVPAIQSGSCPGDVTAVINPTNERLLNITIANVPQFADNRTNLCVRGYSVKITDNVTGVSETVQCQVSIRCTPSGAPNLTINTSGCGSITVVDSGTCSLDRVGRLTGTITSITGGSGNYSIVWGSPEIGVCSIGTWTGALSGSTSQGSTRLDVVFTAQPGVTGTCVYSRDITVTDNITGRVTTKTCTLAMQIVADTTCTALGSTTTGCGKVVTYNNVVGASGTTAAAVLNVTASGGSGQYGISWNTTPTAVTGTCFTQSVTQASTGSASRSLTVKLTGIPTGVDNSSSPCVRTYQYTITDLLTGQTHQGTCAVTFKIIQAARDCGLTLTSKSCGTTAVSLTTTTAQTRTFTLTGLGGKFTAGTYKITWSLSSSCGNKVKFSNGTSSIITTTTGTTSSVPITFQSSVNQNGSCSTVVTADIECVDPDNANAIREYCGTANTCSYTVTWNTQTAPTGSLACTTTAVTLNRTTNSASRTYSISALTNTTSVSWQVTGCPSITVSPRSGTGSSFNVTYTAPTAGAGISGTCAPVITVTLTGPGGSKTYSCTHNVNYNTVPAPIAITSISNCGQTRTITSTTTPRSITFSAMTIDHSAGIGGPYTYQWTRLNQTGTCTPVIFTPVSSTARSMTVTGSVSNDTTGSCVASYQARVRDGNGVWSAPVQCNMTLSYQAPAVQPSLPVNLGGDCVVRTGGSGSSVSYSVSFASTGALTSSKSTSQTVKNHGNWLGTLPGDSPANYDIRFTGSAPAGSSAGIWYPLTTGKNFAWAYVLSGSSGSKHVSGTFDLRRHSTSVIISSSTLLDVQLGVNTECL